MNIKQIEQYSALKNEIKMLQEKLDNMLSKESSLVSDTVKGSSKYFPFTECVLTVTGCDNNQTSRVYVIRERLVNRKARLQTLLGEIEEFIDTVEDSEIRQIIQHKYIEGLPWLVVARKVYGYPCGDRARKRITRFFAEI